MPTPTPTEMPKWPIYDPFILGDNANFMKGHMNCFDDIISDVRVLELYLAIRDAYPTKALKHTRVIALAGMTASTIEMWHESLSKQELNPNPVDMYFYSNYKIVRYVDATLAVPLISLSQYTRPSRIVFGDGSFQREGMKIVLDWMIANKTKGYFVNLEYFQITGHKVAAFNNDEAANQHMNVTEYDAWLRDGIVADLNQICNDKINFPKLKEMNFNNNAYNEFNNGFDGQLRAACDKNTGVEVKARQVTYTYPPMCNPQTPDTTYWYYDMTVEEEIAQCQFTWNWELGNSFTNYAGHGPYPDDETLESCDGLDPLE